MFSHSPFFELFSNRRTWVCCVNNHFPLWCRGVKELVYCHPQPPPPSPLDCYLARGYAVVSIQLCYSSRQHRFFQPTFSPSPSTIWQVVTYLFSWRSVAPAFTGANKTLLNFITIGFYVMVTSLKRLSIRFLVSFLWALVNELQEKWPSLLKVGFDY